MERKIPLTYCSSYLILRLGLKTSVAVPLTGSPLRLDVGLTSWSTESVLGKSSLVFRMIKLIFSTIRLSRPPNMPNKEGGSLDTYRRLYFPSCLTHPTTFCKLSSLFLPMPSPSL